MSHPFTTMRKVIAGVFLLPAFALSAHAEEAPSSTNFRVDLSAGGAYVDEDGYDGGYAFDNAIAYNAAGLNFRGGFLFLDELEPEFADNDENTEVEVRGIYLNLGKEIDLKTIELEVGGGVLFSETEARFFDQVVAEDDDVSPFFNLKVIKNFNRVFGLQGDWKYIHDVSGSNINTLSFGVRLSF